MAAGLKVRLDDGSEVGPLDMPMVRSWYEQGLINADSAVQKAGSKSWTKLAQAVDLKAWGGFAHGASKAIRSRPKSAPSSPGRGGARETADSRSFSDSQLAEHWGTTTGGALLLIVAAFAAYRGLAERHA